MIGKLTGLVDSVEEGYCILDVSGVGYMVFCSARTLGNLTPGQENIALYIDTYIRADNLRLYGFSSLLEKDWFFALQNVKGVGAKIALAVLGTFSPEELNAVIFRQDKTALCRVSGVGKKAAERILVELKSKAVTPLKQGAAAAKSASVEEDVLSALLNLGYPQKTAYQAVLAAQEQAEGDLTVQQLIKASLKELTTP